MKIFILGSQRSGTNLLRMILDSHPEIFCYDEVLSYRYFENKEKLDHNKKYEGFCVPIWTELFAEYDSISNLCGPEDKILFIFRHPKSIVSSMKRMPNFIKFEIEDKIDAWTKDTNRNFKKYLDSIQKYKFKYEKTGDDLLQNYIEESVNSLYRTALVCAYYNYKNETYFKIKQTKNVLPICYEELINNSNQKTKDICKFLNIDWDENMLKHHEKEHAGIIDGVAMGGTDAKRAIDHKSLTLWKTNLLPSEIKLIEKISGRLYEQLLQKSKGALLV